MSIYGRGQGQSLGQGTFTFDKIAPNRYLLDRWANEDRVLPGRYSLIEYTLPLTISEINEQTYEKKSYDVFPKIEEKKENNIVIGFQFDGSDTDENGFLGLKEYIYICQNDNEHAGQYKYFRAEIPGPSISGTEPTSTNEGTPLEFIEIGSYDPYDFNRFIDYAYANYNINDNIASDRFALWDSTAWLKVIENSNGKSNFRYINVADLNVITPTFEVLSSNDDRVPAPMATFDWSDKGTATTATTANFNVPKIKEDKDGVFLIRYPNPMDINIAIDTVTPNNNQDIVSSLYTQDGKNFTFTLGKYATSINHINDFIKNGDWPQQSNTKPSYTVENADTIPDDAGTIWLTIKETYEAIKAANEAIVEATSATQAATAAAENDYSQDLSIDWGIDETEKTYNSEHDKITAIKFAIENKPEIITASDIINLWTNGTLSVPQDNP